MPNTITQFDQNSTRSLHQNFAPRVSFVNTARQNCLRERKMGRYVLAIDQGTTSSRSLVFDDEMRIVGAAQEEFTQHFPQSGWVEHEPEDIWRTTVATAQQSLANAGVKARDIASIGLTNQRETTLIWDRATGEPIHRAIVWQDRRTAEICARLRATGVESLLTERTGLLADPYFSATKVAWLLDNVNGARERAVAGGLLFGTVDSYLIWRMTGAKSHVTDATNASRTMLYDIRKGAWDDEICAILNIPMAMLPEVKDCAADFGVAHADIFGVEIPILGVAGDQQAAMIGQACFEPGMVKATYGTGCFMLLNTGETLASSQNRLLSTIGYQIDGKTIYALEGAIFIAGAAVQWLRDGLGAIKTAAETQALAQSARPGLVLVPAFTGLGAPYWDAACRGAIFGVTRDTGPAEFARAALESVAFQTRDLVEAMRRDWGKDGAETVLRVDGGMTASDWTMQAIADQLQAPVDRAAIQQTTALGVAWLAGWRSGLYPDMAAMANKWRVDQRFAPALAPADAHTAYAGWQDAISRTLTKPN
jgi:glycerol kinase